MIVVDRTSGLTIAFTYVFFVATVPSSVRGIDLVVKVGVGPTKATSFSTPPARIHDRDPLYTHTSF